MKLQLPNLQAKASSIILIQSKIPIFWCDIKPLLTTQIRCLLICKLGIICILKFKNSSFKAFEYLFYRILISFYTACLYLFLKQDLSIEARQAETPLELTGSSYSSRCWLRKVCTTHPALTGFHINVLNQKGSSHNFRNSMPLNK